MQKLWTLPFLFTISLVAEGRQVGREAAQKYMSQKPEEAAVQMVETPPEERVGYDSGSQSGLSSTKKNRGPSNVSRGPSERMLMIQVGKFISDRTYQWGVPKSTDNGEWLFGFTYKMSELQNVGDVFLRAEVQNYNLPKGDARKLSLTALFTLPDGASQFPLYFGVGLGPGIFFKQLPDESVLSLDYSLVVGGRLLNLWESTGLFIETGLKDHVHLLTNGHFAEAIFISSGVLFTF